MLVDHEKKDPKEEASIERIYEKAINVGIGGNSVFPHQAKQQMAAMIEEAARANEKMATFVKWENRPEQLGGFLAEEFHATTFNMDNILKKGSARAETGLDNNVIGNNDKISDIVVIKDGETVVRVQSKYMNTPQATAAQHSQLDKATSKPKYGQADVALAPSDQTEAVREQARNSAERHAAKAQDLTQQGGEQRHIDAHNAKAEAHQHTADKASSTIEYDGASSTELTKAEADQMGEGDLGKIQKIQSEYKTASTLQQMRRAAVAASAMSAVVSGAFNTVRYLSMAREGKISRQDAVVKIVAETAASAVDSAIKASLVSGGHSTLARLAGHSAIAPLASQGLGMMMRGNLVTVAALCAVDAVKDMVRLAMGDIDTETFQERQGKGVLNTSAGIMGASLGGAAMAALCAEGAVVLPMAGALSGGLIAGIAMNFAIENGIEAPYREIAENVELTKEAARILEGVSREFIDGQIAFEAFLKMDSALDQAYQAVNAAATADAMRRSIDRI